MLVATHLLEEADACDRVGILDRGRLVADDAPEALKAALGGDALWIATPAPEALRDRLEAQFGLAARIVGGAVQLAHPSPHTLLPTLYDAFGDDIESATLRKPSLEDVFLLHAGYRLEAPPVLMV